MLVELIQAIFTITSLAAIYKKATIAREAGDLPKGIRITYLQGQASRTATRYDIEVIRSAAKEYVAVKSELKKSRDRLQEGYATNNIEILPQAKRSGNKSNTPVPHMTSNIDGHVVATSRYLDGMFVFELVAERDDEIFFDFISRADFNNKKLKLPKDESGGFILPDRVLPKSVTELFIRFKERDSGLPADKIEEEKEEKDSPLNNAVGGLIQTDLEETLNRIKELEERLESLKFLEDQNGFKLDYEHVLPFNEGDKFAEFYPVGKPSMTDPEKFLKNSEVIPGFDQEKSKLSYLIGHARYSVEVSQRKIYLPGFRAPLFSPNLIDFCQERLIEDDYSFNKYRVEFFENAGTFADMDKDGEITVIPIEPNVKVLRSLNIYPTVEFLRTLSSNLNSAAGKFFSNFLQSKVAISRIADTFSASVKNLIKLYVGSIENLTPEALKSLEGLDEEEAARFLAGYKKPTSKAAVPPPQPKEKEKKKKDKKEKPQKKVNEPKDSKSKNPKKEKVSPPKKDPSKGKNSTPKNKKDFIPKKFFLRIKKGDNFTATRNKILGAFNSQDIRVIGKTIRSALNISTSDRVDFFAAANFFNKGTLRQNTNIDKAKKKVLKN